MNRKWFQSTIATIVFVLYWSLGGVVPGIHANQRQEIARLAELMQWKAADASKQCEVRESIGSLIILPLGHRGFSQKNSFFHILSGLYQIVRGTKITPIIFIGSKGEDSFPVASQT